MAETSIGTDVFSSDGSDGVEIPTNDSTSNPIDDHHESHPHVPLARIRRVLREQFDLELLLKRHELAAVRAELERTRRIQASLRSLIVHGTDPDAQGVEDDDVPTTPVASTPADDLRIDENLLYVRRNDGLFARVFCPQCTRVSFSSVQGFVNHCRIRHNLTFPSNNIAVAKCSVPVDESEVPIDDPSRAIGSRVYSSFLSGSSVSAFSMPTALSLEAAASVMAVVAPITFRPPTKAVGIKVYEESVDLDEFAVPESSTLPAASSSTLSFTLQDCDDHDGIMSMDEDGCTDPDADKDDDHHDMDVSADGVTRNSTTPATQSNQSVDPVTSSTIAGGASGFNKMSRFHTIREIVVGNTSRLIVPNTNAAGRPKNNGGGGDNNNAADGSADYRFKWMVYLREPNIAHGGRSINTGDPTTTTTSSSSNNDIDNSQNLGRLIRKVRFFLHPDYRPFDVVDVTSPPFQLIRYGWGECPVRLQIHFWDPVNKPINVIHVLRLSLAQPGVDVKSSERVLEIEIDRNTQLRRLDTVTASSSGHDHLRVPVDTSGDVDMMLGPHIHQRDRERATTMSMTAATMHTTSKDKIDGTDSGSAVPNKDERLPADDNICRLVELGCRRFPIIRRTDVPESSFPYSTTTSHTDYMSWPVGKRKATEHQRALAVHRFVQKDSGKVVSPAAIAMWCRVLGLTPSLVVREGHERGVSPMPDCGVHAQRRGSFSHTGGKELMRRSLIGSVPPAATVVSATTSAADSIATAAAPTATTTTSSDVIKTSKTYCRTCGKLACNMCLPLFQIRFNSTTRLALGAIPDPHDMDMNVRDAGSSTLTMTTTVMGSSGLVDVDVRGASMAITGRNTDVNKSASTTTASPSQSSLSSSLVPHALRQDTLCDIDALEKRWLWYVVDKLPSCRWQEEPAGTTHTAGNPNHVEPMRVRMSKPLPRALVLVHMAVKAFLNDVLRGAVGAYASSMASRRSDEEDDEDEDGGGGSENNDDSDGRVMTKHDRSRTTDTDTNPTNPSRRSDLHDASTQQHPTRHTERTDTHKTEKRTRTHMYSDAPPKALLVPPHVYEGIVANPRLGFLTNQGMLDVSGDGEGDVDDALKTTR